VDNQLDKAQQYIRDQPQLVKFYLVENTLFQPLVNKTAAWQSIKNESTVLNHIKESGPLTHTLKSSSLTFPAVDALKAACQEYANINCVGTDSMSEAISEMKRPSVMYA